MPRVKALKPRLGVMADRLRKAPRIGSTKRTRGSAWVAKRAKWLTEHPLCRHCEQLGYVRMAQEVDHVVPLWEGGADDATNYQSLCVEHHQAKTAEEAKRRNSA